MPVQSTKMTPTELRASMGLAAIAGLRMLGLFIILPVFALYAARLPGGSDHTRVGLAIGAYGLTQAILQLPFGWLSDRYGRKPIIYAGLAVFALGSFVAAAASTINMVILGRVIQGAGAISAAVNALTADLTRAEQRTKAMAMIGATIGISFAVSIIVAPLLSRWVGVPGIFTLTGILALAAMAIVASIVPNPRPGHGVAEEREPGVFRRVLRDKELVRLNFGIFVLHAVLMPLFIVVPFALEGVGLPGPKHWQVYLPVVIGSFVLMLPAVLSADRAVRAKRRFLSAIALLIASQLILAGSGHSFWAICLALLVFFTAFNVLEASLPSMISKLAPGSAKGSAFGVYSIFQFLGAFAGGLCGGAISQHFGAPTVFVCCAALTAVWFALALPMRVPAPAREEHAGLQFVEGR
jgi:MFS family permease